MFAFTRFRTWLSHKPMQKCLLGLAVLVCLQNPLNAATVDELGTKARHHLHLAYVQGEGDVQGIKLAVQRESDLFTEHLQDYGIAGAVSFEMSANFWRFGPKNETDQNVVLAFSPVFTFSVGRFFDKEVLAEFGIGFSLLDDTTFAGKNVSTHYQFEDRLGLIYRVSNKDSVTLRYLHYSNAGFKKPNPGLDFISLGYSRVF